ncbi:hypothetical protein LBMAG26_11300 [Bacteroidota bacterium]|nr:hypothetical protein LBMAG26_11300 [Bacteroidota bacterium]
MDIIILTIIISLLFIVFALGPIFLQEFNIAKRKTPDINVNQFIKKYFLEGKDLSKMEKKDVKVLYQKISSTIADMESNGVYFPDEVKKELEKIQKES